MGDHTTLFTFRIDVPSGTRSVELLGSWDNFTHSYRMERDQRKSSRQWCGIFTFKDIICDGEPQGRPEKREGGLKMGGTYWYYYMLDGVYEYHDESKPFTTTCPLLLGECVNILEVPYEERSDDFDPDFPPAPVLTPAFTMDPNARFSTPRPNKFEALSRKPSVPPPSPFFPSPVTPSCEDSCRSSLAPTSDQSCRSFTSAGAVSHRTSYSRHGHFDLSSSSHGYVRPKTAGGATTAQQARHLNLRSNRPASVGRSDPATSQDRKPGFWRNDSGIAGHGLSGGRDNSGSKSDVAAKVGLAEQQSGQQPERRHTGAPAVDFEEDVLSDSGATLACWQHRECLIRKRNGLAETGAQERLIQEAYQAVDTWIEHTTIALLGGEFPWDIKDISTPEISPTRSEFTDILDSSMMLERGGYWSSYEDELRSSDDSSSFSKVGRLPCVEEEAVEEASTLEFDEPLHRCFSETERYIEDFELPPVLTLDSGIEDIAQTLATPGQAQEEDCGVLTVEPQGSFLNMDRFTDSFKLPPLNTQISVSGSSLLDDVSQSAVTSTTVDLPQLEDSAMHSPTCSSPCTASSARAESFQFWADQDGEEDEVEESYLDYSSSATSPGLLPTISHTRTNSWFSNSGFQGYSLPEDEYSSQATLTKISTQATMVMSEPPPLSVRRHSTLRVNSELESMDELLNDFSYLGEAVIG
ncbi:uncharacterized protein LTHEOB_2584 [Lasiodiplodia theobromae]|uniref:uncharacterized protein n=1 Tax=Lasiodiplodia theobromae TaxID=45133 RepID=UPI0015C344CA|nr:uncharacterized protein LTHEOB_2584 [Lasiodiplodia theobromae]KAF4535592.1 hypothetical protein LTHEOB_2584 [Lasiodiplodia theobromae]